MDPETQGRLAGRTVLVTGGSSGLGAAGDWDKVIGFSRALAAETRGQIGVTALIPGGMNTAFFDHREEKYKPADPSALNDPARVADAVLFALGQPKGCEIREMLVCPSGADSWP